MDGESGAAYLHRALTAAGVELLVGLPGTQTLPLDRRIAGQDEIDYVMARHETAIPHIAWGYYEVAGRPAGTLTVPGPGETNAMHGLKNTLEDCVPIMHMTGDSPVDHRGKKPIHEIDPSTFDSVDKRNLHAGDVIASSFEPTNSWPGTTGYSNPRSCCHMWTSESHTPVNSTRRSTWSACGSGTGIVRRSRVPSAVRTIVSSFIPGPRRAGPKTWVPARYREDQLPGPRRGKTAAATLNFAS